MHFWIFRCFLYILFELLEIYFSFNSDFDSKFYWLEIEYKNPVDEENLEKVTEENKVEIIGRNSKKIHDDNQAESNDEEIHENVYEENKIKDQVEGVEVNTEENCESNQHKVTELNFVEKFFNRYWVKWIRYTWYFIIPMSFTWIGIAIWWASKLETSNEALEILNDSSYITVTQNMIMYDYHNTDESRSIQVIFVWGTNYLDNSNVDKWDSTSYGTIIYDELFDLAPEANQQRIIDICNDLKKSSLVRDSKVSCWVQDFVNKMNGGNPVPESLFYQAPESYPQTTEGQDHYANFEIGYLNRKLKFIRVLATSTQVQKAGYKILYPVYQDWEKLKDDYNNASPRGVNDAIETGQWD